MREFELKITNKGVVRLRKGEILTWGMLEDTNVVVTLRYITRQEEAKLTAEALYEAEEK